MNILLLGGNGFIGSSIVSELLQVTGVKLTCATRKINNFIDADERLDWVYLDVSSHENRMKIFIEEADIVINCIGELEDTSTMEKTNFELVKHIVNILNELKMPHKRLIQISSVGCYGATTRFKGLSHIVTEHEIEKPVGLYEETKTKADDYIRSVLSKGNESISYTILRPTNVFGISMKSQAILNIASMVKKGLFFYISDKSAVSTYVHVDDVAQSVRLVIENMSLSRNQTYIISDDCDQYKFIETLADLFTVKQPRLVVPLFFVMFGVFLGRKLSNSFPLTLSKVASLTSKVSFSNKKIQELGFKPLFSIYKKEVVNSILKDWSLK